MNSRARKDVSRVAVQVRSYNSTSEVGNSVWTTMQFGDYAGV